MILLRLVRWGEQLIRRISYQGDEVSLTPKKNGGRASKKKRRPREAPGTGKLISFNLVEGSASSGRALRLAKTARLILISAHFNIQPRRVSGETEKQTPRSPRIPFLSFKSSFRECNDITSDYSLYNVAVIQNIHARYISIRLYTRYLYHSLPILVKYRRCKYAEILLTLQIFSI